VTERRYHDESDVANPPEPLLKPKAVGLAKLRRAAKDFEVSDATEIISTDADAGDNFDFATGTACVDIAIARVNNDFGPIARGRMIQAADAIEAQKTTKPAQTGLKPA
jgi:hypothetical protein